jgi:uncharacterized protein YacL
LSWGESVTGAGVSARINRRNHLFAFLELYMSVDLIFRLLGVVIIGGLGLYWGLVLGKASTNSMILFAGIGLFIGALVGWFITPYITTRPARALRQRLSKVPAQTLVSGMIGLIVGLIIAALLAIPLSSLPQPLGNILPVVGALFAVYLGVAVFVARQSEIFDVFRYRFTRESTTVEETKTVSSEDSTLTLSRMILMDTSVIIDGRIADIARTGFLVGSLLIPRFILNELQYIADSADGLRRQRGRRGMEVLAQLQKDSSLPIHISDIDVEGVRDVDDKLVTLARQLQAPILTNDYNLNRVAELQGVIVLNINDLANAVKTVLLPGETLTVILIQEGRESGQGIAYLDDGTMVVVEDSREYIGQEVNVTVTKVLQTSAGRMIFGRLGSTDAG